MLEKKKAKVVVIGAGIAGLAAAYRLFQQGADVDVYEDAPKSRRAHSFDQY